MPTLAPIAGCTLVTLAPEPCAPTWPTDPVGLGPVAVGARGVIPLTDPPFTATHWVQRPGVMPNIGGLPTQHWVQFSGFTYVAYQGQFQNLPGLGPVNMNMWVGSIARTADGATWQTVFNGTAPPATGLGYLMPGMLFVRGDTLYCVVYSGGSSFANWACMTAGGIAIWKTTDGVAWTQHQVLVSWPAAGDRVGDGAGVTFLRDAKTLWRAAGSGPAGETADWLVVSYAAGANVPGAPVSHMATPCYRSLDAGATWAEVRNMKGVHPFTANPTTVDGPGVMLAVPRPGVATDRWVMLGGINTVNYSDNDGATWTASSSSGGHTGPSDAKILQTGGMVFVLPGTGAFGPGEQISCDYGASRLLIATSGVAGNPNTTFSVLQFGTAGGEELLAATARTGQAVWHTTNGGETWEDRGDMSAGAAVSYGLARAPTGRVLLYRISGGGGAIDLWTCDDDPTGIPTPRTICPFVVDTGVPVGQIAGCASLTFITELCHALPPPPFGPGFETCAAPLGLFVLGENCLGPLEVSPTAARRVPRRWSHAHAQ